MRIETKRAADKIGELISDHIDRFIPSSSVGTNSSGFVWSMPAELESAESDGYEVFHCRDYTSRLVKGDKVCVYYEPDDYSCGIYPWVEYRHRGYYKGKPTTEFQLHRDDDRPAYIGQRAVSWYKNGEYSRDNGPSHVSMDEVIYCKDGRWHRTDGPAKISKFFGLSWFENHKRVKKSCSVCGSEENCIVTYDMVCEKCDKNGVVFEFDVVSAQV